MISFVHAPWRPLLPVSEPKIGKIYKLLRPVVIYRNVNRTDLYQISTGELFLILDYNKTRHGHEYKVLYDETVNILDFSFDSPLEDRMKSGEIFEEVV